MSIFEPCISLFGIVLHDMPLSILLNREALAIAGNYKGGLIAMTDDKPFTYRGRTC